MYKPISNNKGVILISAYLVVLVIIVLSAAFFSQTISESRNVQRTKASLEAFYAAQAGLNFAYIESERFPIGAWKTHNWNWAADPAPTPDVAVSHANPLSLSALGADWDADGYYIIPDYNFRVHAYQEINWDLSTTEQPVYTGIIIINSQGWDRQDMVRRTAELRLRQNSIYFCYFPETHIFDNGTYDGSGYGRIHVNGNIIFKNSPVFTNLTQLSAGDTYGYATSEHTGYLKYDSSQYSAPYAWDDNDSVIDGSTPMPRNSYPPYDYFDPEDWYAADYRFNQHAQNYARLNEDSDGNAFIIPRTLNEGSDYAWEYDKYEGSQSYDEVGVRFRVDNDALSWLACTERDVSRGGPASHTLLTQDAQNTFNQAPASFNWELWKTSHPDYEKEFWRARYDCLDTGNWATDADTTSAGFAASANYAINHEWWDDLVYGNDRSWDDLAPAQSEVPGSPDYGGYFLNSEEQILAWQQFMSNKEVTITKANTGQTETLPLSSVIKEASSGGKYVSPIGLETDYLQQAQQGGILITKGESPDYLQWFRDSWEILRRQGFFAWIRWLRNNPVPTQHSWQNPIADVCSTDYFFNTTRPAESSEDTSASSLWDKFPAPDSLEKTKVLTIDVAALKKKIETEGMSFNGTIYVEDPDPEVDGYNDFSVRLINGGVLPETGLTLVSPHNIYVQGNFNLDNTLPEGVYDPAEARDYEAIENYLGYHPDEGYSSSDFVWHSASLISTQRLIYTLSEDFNDPQQLPLSYDYWNGDTRENYPYCLNDRTFLNNYCPQPGDNDLPDTVKHFLNQRFSAQTRPERWDWDWIEANMNTDLYPEANDIRKDLLDAGNEQYRTANESLMPNRVLHEVTYNTAMFSPYEPQGYTLERWYDEDGNQKSRKIVGAFIQLEDSNRASVPLAYLKYNSQGEEVYTIDSGLDSAGRYHYAYYWHGNQPHNDSTYSPSHNYTYETNLQQSGIDSIESWREISPGEF